jgi:hypothetical protein
MTPEHITIAQAAQLRGVTRHSIHRWIRAGLRHAWRGRVIVIDRNDLAAFVPRPPGNPTPWRNGRRRRR